MVRNTPVPGTREILRGREADLGPEIKKILHGSYIFPDIEQLRSDYSKWHDPIFKIDRSSIIAILTDAVWYDSKFGLAREKFNPLPPKHTWLRWVGMRSRPSLPKQLSVSFKKALTIIIGTIRGENSHKLHPLVKRLDTYVDILNENENHLHDMEGTSALFISRGVGTADKIMGGLIEAFIRISNRRRMAFTKQEAREILNTAASNVLDVLASLNLGSITYWQKHLHDYRLYDLRKKGGTWEIVVREEIIRRRAQNRKHPFMHTNHLGPTIWCPARYAVGGNPPVINQYFHWILDVVFQHDPRFASLPDSAAAIEPL